MTQKQYNERSDSHRYLITRRVSFNLSRLNISSDYNDANGNADQETSRSKLYKLISEDKNLDGMLVVNAYESINPIIVGNSVCLKKIDETGHVIPISQRIDFNLSNSSVPKSEDKLTLIFDFCDNPYLSQVLCNGNVTAFRNGQEISMFDISDKQLLQVMPYFPTLERQCIECSELAERLLCFDLSNDNYVERKAMETLMQKKYVSAGICLLNYFQMRENIAFTHPSRNWYKADEAGHHFSMKARETSSEIDSILHTKNNTSGKKALQKLKNKVRKEETTIKSNFDLLKIYCTYMQQEKAKEEINTYDLKEGMEFYYVFSKRKRKDIAIALAGYLFSKFVLPKIIGTIRGDIRTKELLKKSAAVEPRYITVFDGGKEDNFVPISRLNDHSRS